MKDRTLNKKHFRKFAIVLGALILLFAFINWGIPLLGVFAYYHTFIQANNPVLLIPDNPVTPTPNFWVSGFIFFLLAIIGLVGIVAVGGLIFVLGRLLFNYLFPNQNKHDED